ncbi:MAG: hypothetical protein JST00_04155 [Deltaproteobacteria bacterium]|nr:hypothetical protein [Deltaproteobacteria bacterium]
MKKVLSGVLLFSVGFVAVTALAAPAKSSIAKATQQKGASPPAKSESKPAAASAAAPAPAPAPPQILSIPTARFCPTSGKISPLGPFSMRVDMGGMRGVIAGDKSDTAELAFTYKGPSTTTTPLADGTVRRQIGLRLRAQDTCNAVYIMWHAAPTQKIAVSTKSNPGQSTHAQCLDRGYINLKPTLENVPPAIEVGKPRTLRAEIVGTTLTVKADGAVAWEGTLPPEAFAFSGPVGIRSDNGTFDFEMRVPDGTKGQTGCAGVIRD